MVSGEAGVRGGLDLQTRRALLKQMAARYQEASAAKKRLLVDELTHTTGYHRTYTQWLLNHSEQVLETGVRHPRSPRYGSDVVDALVQVWNANNRKCSKCLIPFLPTLLDSLERHGHLHLTDACRALLLSMSAATADRLLRAARTQDLHGISTTRAGTLLKQQIPIRTFQQWNETQPGFVEADLVAHCGVDRGAGFAGGFVYTLTMTDVATGWTECLPLLYQSPETVLAAIERARSLFPFPLLGIDTDNGGEFINTLLVSYCDQEHLTFTRGRPRVKNDQCFVEEKNRTIVREVVGYDRFVGEQAYRQLEELYRALRLYVNCFQPSMKLLSKQRHGKKLSLCYDPAKTPLQRLLLSGILPTHMQQELNEVALALDPIRLLEHVQQIQQTLFHCAVEANPFVSPAVVVPLRVFAVEQCTPGGLAKKSSLAPSRGVPTLYQEQEKRKRVLGWRRTHNDPFAGEWEQIVSWVQAHPERSSGDIFRELQRLSPGRYQPLQIRTLQRGMRTIRAILLETAQEPWREEVIQGHASDRIEPAQRTHEACSLCSGSLDSAVTPTLENARERPCTARSGAEEEAMDSPEGTVPCPGDRPVTMLDGEPPQADQVCNSSVSSNGLRKNGGSKIIEQAIQDYLQEQRNHNRRPKTVEWHQTALGLFQHYLLNACHLTLLSQITETEIQGWVALLGQQPTSRGTLRAAGTIASYMRSARACCQWFVRHHLLERTPFTHLPLLKEEPSLFHLLEPEEWERLLRVCRPLGGKVILAEQVAARNQALLWVLAETGIRTSEVCELRLADVDREQGRLRVRGKGSKLRWVPLRQEGLRHLLVYLGHARLAAMGKRRQVGEEPLFVSETGRPLTDNGIALLFGRLRKRAGITRKDVNPSLLRESFAVRYLQAGGDLFTLRELLGQEEGARVKRYLRMSEEVMENERMCQGLRTQKEGRR